MSTKRRLAGGRIDRSTPLSFEFDGRRYRGYAGDTLAAALLANGQRLLGRSFKYHRPRGVLSAGVEEPNALVELGRGEYLEPNTRTTTTELFAGLVARSQNYRGTLRFDLMAINDYIAPLLTAGFYYKTFMWPRSFWERFYEPLIRASAGLGSLSGKADPSMYDKGFMHADLLVVGAGPAGLAAALTAGRAGARVLLVDEDFLPGGRLNAQICYIADLPGHQWAAESMRELESLDNVRLLTRTSLYGVFDHGIYGAVERCAPQRERRDAPRMILWRIYAPHAVVCAGATERMIAFADNDRPGIMLAGAVRSYVNRFAVAPGNTTVVFTNNDTGWHTARDLLDRGAEVAAIVDVRAVSAPVDLPGVEIITDETVCATQGRLAIKSVTLSNGRRLQADCLAVSGGWNPNLHLSCHQRGRPRWEESIAAFVPHGELPPGLRVAGAANGELSLQAALEAGRSNATAVLDALGISAADNRCWQATEESTAVQAYWHVPGRGRAWIDQQNDVTVKDVALAHQEGYGSVEHLKRYTTLGMATDQGKTSGVLGLAILAAISSKSIANTGTTIFRPPYTPVPIGAFAGRSRGSDFRPVRRTPSHAYAEQNGANFVESGLWLRAQWFPEPGEKNWRASVNREVKATRSAVGICDVSTLGKIDVQGRDAAEFLDKVYANTMSTMSIGKVRYGLMLREDGIVMDDGTTARLAEQHFLMTTTTANADAVFRHLEFCRQCLWPGLDVHLNPVTEQWAQFAVAGPRSRELLQELTDPPFNIGNDAFPFMSCMNLTICQGVTARLYRISFSGELAYELAVPARYGNALMAHLVNLGKPLGAVAYGTEALNVMRIEKGHAAGNELNGTTTAHNLGLGKMVSKKKDSIGNLLSQRKALSSDVGLALVGIKPSNPAESFRAGAHFVSPGKPCDLAHDEGYVTSVTYSPKLGHTIGLGLIERGVHRSGERVQAVDPLGDTVTDVQIVAPQFVDPEGVRLRV